MARFRHRTLEIVDLYRSTTTPRGPLPLAPTARGGEGVLARPCPRRIGDPLWLRTTVGADRGERYQQDDRARTA